MAPVGSPAEEELAKVSIEWNELVDKGWKVAIPAVCWEAIWGGLWGSDTEGVGLSCAQVFSGNATLGGSYPSYYPDIPSFPGSLVLHNYHRAATQHQVQRVTVLSWYIQDK